CCDAVTVFNFFFFSSRSRHTRFSRDWSSDVCSSDLMGLVIRRRVVLGAVAHIELRSTLRIHLDGRATHAALLRAHRPRGHNDTEHGQHRGSERDPTHAAGLPTESHSTSSSLGSMTPPTRHVLHRVPQGGLHGPSPPGRPT